MNKQQENYAAIAYMVGAATAVIWSCAIVSAVPLVGFGIIMYLHFLILSIKK